MRVVRVRNVAQAWSELPDVLRYDAEEQDSRAGWVLVCPEPVATVYSHPRERVLLDARRDCNPFFHLVEALWMLAGRDDPRVLDHYVRDFGERFGEKVGAVRIHGAYGHRWRNAMGVDQLDVIVSKLRDNPLDRQAVLQMWNADTDACDDLLGTWRDRPCNTHAYFRVRSTAYRDPPVTDQNSAMHEGRIATGRDKVLDMTVCCRSNDMVFGGYGANAVHFSVLQEYLAARIGVEVGTYTQVSNNFHVYRDVWKRVKPDDPSHIVDCYTCSNSVKPMPMFEEPNDVDADLWKFFRWHEELWTQSPNMTTTRDYANPWFTNTAQRVALAYWGWRNKMPREQIGLIAAIIEAPDWQRACTEWLQRRAARG